MNRRRFIVGYKILPALYRRQKQYNKILTDVNNLLINQYFFHKLLYYNIL